MRVNLEIGNLFYDAIIHFSQALVWAAIVLAVGWAVSACIERGKARRSEDGE